MFERGLDPTNSHAERELRGLVCWRPCPYLFGDELAAIPAESELAERVTREAWMSVYANEDGAFSRNIGRTVSSPATTDQPFPCSRVVRDVRDALVALAVVAATASCGTDGTTTAPFFAYGLGNAKVTKMNAVGTIAAQLENGHVALFEAGRWRDLGVEGLPIDLNDNGWLLFGSSPNGIPNLRLPDGTIEMAPERSRALDNQNRVYGTVLVRGDNQNGYVYRAFRMARGGTPEPFGAELNSGVSTATTIANPIELTSASSDGSCVMLQSVVSGGLDNGLPPINTYRVSADGQTTHLNTEVFGLPAQLPDKIEDLVFQPSATAHGPNGVTALCLPGGGLVATIRIEPLSPIHSYFVKDGRYVHLSDYLFPLAQTANQIVMQDSFNGGVTLVDVDGAVTQSDLNAGNYVLVATNGMGLGVARVDLIPGVALVVSTRFPDPNGDAKVVITGTSGSPPEATPWKNFRSDVALSADRKMLELFSYSLAGDMSPLRSVQVRWSAPQGFAVGGPVSAGPGAVKLYVQVAGSNTLAEHYASTAATLTVKALGERSIQLLLEADLAGSAGTPTAQTVHLTMDLTHGWLGRI